MAYICKDCENKTAFVITHCIVERCTERNRINEHGDVEDTIDINIDDRDVEGEEDLVCDRCTSTHIENVTDEEWEKWHGPIDETKPWQSRLQHRRNI